MRQTLPILVVEDESGIAELLRYTLDAAGFSVEVAPSARAAREVMARVLPQAVLLDWMLPDIPGIALLEEWRHHPRSASVPILLLTAKGLDEDKVRGLNAGADDYITKPFSPREMIARLNAVLRRYTPVDVSAKLSAGTITIDEERHLVQVQGEAISLGAAEFKLLRFLVANQDRVFSRAQLLDKVWGDHVFFEERTVDVHIMRLRKCLGVAGDYIKTIRSVGYSLQVSLAS